MAPRFWTV